MSQKDLIPMNRRTKEEQKAIARKGGKASVIARRNKKTFREAIATMLCGRVPVDSPLYREAKKIMSALGVDGEPYGMDIVNLGVFKRAAKGDTAAAAFLRDTIGEKPTEVVENKEQRPPVVLGIIPVKNKEQK